MHARLSSSYDQQDMAFPWSKLDTHCADAVALQTPLISSPSPVASFEMQPWKEDQETLSAPRVRNAEVGLCQRSRHFSPYLRKSSLDLLLPRSCAYSKPPKRASPVGQLGRKHAEVWNKSQLCKLYALVTAISWIYHLSIGGGITTGFSSFGVDDSDSEENLDLRGVDPDEPRDDPRSGEGGWTGGGGGRRGEGGDSTLTTSETWKKVTKACALHQRGGPKNSTRVPSSYSGHMCTPIDYLPMLFEPYLEIGPLPDCGCLCPHRSLSCGGGRRWWLFGRRRRRRRRRRHPCVPLSLLCDGRGVKLSPGEGEEMRNGDGNNEYCRTTGEEPTPPHRRHPHVVTYTLMSSHKMLICCCRCCFLLLLFSSITVAYFWGPHLSQPLHTHLRSVAASDTPLSFSLPSLSGLDLPVIYLTFSPPWRMATPPDNI